MSPITIITTIAYGIGFPIFIEIQHVYNKIWDILIDLQRVLIEVANKYLWPWVAELLKLINFESIKKLYQDISEGKMPDQCVRDYIDRAGLIEYAFIMFMSITLFVSIFKLIVSPFENYLLDALIIKQFAEKHPVIFKIFFYPFMISLIHWGYMATAYILYELNRFKI